MIKADAIFKIHKPTKFFFAGVLMFLLIGVGIINEAKRTDSVSGYCNFVFIWRGLPVPSSFTSLSDGQLFVLFQKTVGFYDGKFYSSQFFIFFTPGSNIIVSTDKFKIVSNLLNPYDR